MAKSKKDFNCSNCKCKPNQTYEIPGLLPLTLICPGKLVVPQAVEWLRLYDHYENGVLPFSGGLLEQPNNYLEAMDIIRSRM